MKLVTAKQMREIDRQAIEERGIPAYRLMESAGRAIATNLADDMETGSVAVICGKGNNGGDGFVAARILAQSGWNVSVIFVKEPTCDAGAAREAWDALPTAMRRKGFDEIDDLSAFIAQHDAAIDALLGTGAKGAPRPPYDAIISAVNDAHVPVYAADIPSGLDPDSGAGELVVRAYCTVAIGLAKIGMVTSNGAKYCGRIVVEEIDFPADLLDCVTPYSTLTLPEAAALLPERPADGHKGTFGKLLLAAGSAAMPGAVVLAGEGALRGGCGLVQILTPHSVHPAVYTQLPEVLLSDKLGDKDHFSPLDESVYKAALTKTTAAAIGPGIGQAEPTREFVAQFLDRVRVPTVVDADALNVLASDLELRKKLNPDCVLTPHPGELSRLLERSVEEIEKDRWQSAIEAARKFGCVVLLKGAGTIVAEPNGNATIVGGGSTALSRGGAGDILTGLIGSLLAQKCAPADAANLGAMVHCLAAGAATRDRSSRGVTIREILACIPLAFRELESIV